MNFRRDRVSPQPVIRRRRFRFWILGLAFFLGTGLVFFVHHAHSESREDGQPKISFPTLSFGSGENKEQKSLPPTMPEPQIPNEVEAAPVEKIDNGDIPITVYPGRVDAFQRSTLTFRVSGPLQKIYVEPGTHVLKGDKLMQIDQRDYIIQVDLAKSRLDAARADFEALKQGVRPEDVALLENRVAQMTIAREVAEKEYERDKVLVETKAVSESDFDAARQNFVAADLGLAAAKKELEKGKAGGRAEEIDAAQANIRGLEAQLKTAENNLADTTLTAPYDGVITAKLIEEYEMVTVTPTYREVIGIQDISRLKINVFIPEKEIATGRFVPDFAVEVRFNVRPEQTYQAKLFEIETTPTRGGMTYKTTFVLDAPQEIAVLPGMSCEVLIPDQSVSSGGKENSSAFLTVPAEAVSGEAVWVLDPVRSTVSRRKVKCGPLSADGRFLLLSGLTEGERVVVRGGESLKEGETVHTALK